MLNPCQLVSIYVDDLRPLPTELMMIVLEFSGLVHRGQRSLSFWVYWRRPIARLLTSRAPRSDARSRRRFR